MRFVELQNEVGSPDPKADMLAKKLGELLTFIYVQVQNLRSRTHTWSTSEELKCNVERHPHIVTIAWG